VIARETAAQVILPNIDTIAATDLKKKGGWQGNCLGTPKGGSVPKIFSSRLITAASGSYPEPEPYSCNICGGGGQTMDNNRLATSITLSDS
jgi:hypothetical protein